MIIVLYSALSDLAYSSFNNLRTFYDRVQPGKKSAVIGAILTNRNIKYTKVSYC